MARSGSVQKPQTEFANSSRSLRFIALFVIKERFVITVCAHTPSASNPFRAGPVRFRRHDRRIESALMKTTFVPFASLVFHRQMQISRNVRRILLAFVMKKILNPAVAPPGHLENSPPRISS